MVDSADKARLWEARDELLRALTNPYMTPGIPVLVLANKQDLPGKNLIDTAIRIPDPYTIS